MTFHNRDALQIENDHLRVTVLKGGGHIAEILHKRTGVNPLWIPPWPTIDPSNYDPASHPSYGLNDESRLLSGIAGHSLCLDIFGPPSAEDVRAGISVHGEGSITDYDGHASGTRIQVCARLGYSQLQVERTITLDGPERVRIRESVQNLSSAERPIGWTQHVSLGPPFLVADETQLHIRAERSRVFEHAGFDAGGLQRGADFRWPHAPSRTNETATLSTFGCGRRQASFTTHLMDRTMASAFFVAYSPTLRLLFGYRWNRSDFPWLGIWEENRSRTADPWRAEAVVCGMEFGVSPFPESREHMIERGKLFGVPAFRTLATREHVTVEYSAFICETRRIQQLADIVANDVR